MSKQTSPAASDRSPDHLELGRRGEEFAAAYLQQSGCRLVVSNFTVPIGRSRVGNNIYAEIDLVVYDGDTLCFVEVKTRASDWFAAPQANVNLRKQRQIARAARAYRRIFGLMDAPYRYDVISILLSSEQAASEPQIEVLRNFWSEEKFRKRRWTERYWE
jgi:putative endonuclease